MAHRRILTADQRRALSASPTARVSADVATRWTTTIFCSVL